MQNQGRANIFAVGWLVIVAAALLAPAQTTNTLPTAKIPFDFFVGSEHMPAGRYQLEFSTESVFRLLNLDNQANARLFTLPEGPPLEPKGAKLVFFLREGKYMLAGLAGPGGKQRLSMYYGMSPGKGDVREEVPLVLPQ